MAHRLITALSMGRTLRETMLCAAVMMCAATSTGSTVEVGMRAVAARARHLDRHAVGRGHHRRRR